MVGRLERARGPAVVASNLGADPSRARVNPDVRPDALLALMLLSA